MISKEKKAAIMKEYARTEGDTGSPEVQVAVLTARIQELTEHLQSNHSLLVCGRGRISIRLPFYASGIVVLMCMRCIFRNYETQQELFPRLLKRLFS